MQNISANRYQTTPRTLTFIFNKNKVLLLRNSPEKSLWPNFLNGVGGHVKSDETIYNSASREIAEETGITNIDSLKLRGIINIAVDVEEHHGVLLFVFIATTTTNQLISSSEGVPAWYDHTELPLRELVPDLTTLLPKLNALQANELLYGHYSYADDGTLVQTLTPE